MEKQMIEEMAKTYCQNGFKCDENCQTNGCRVYEVCTELYNAGYRKIPEGAVVLTRSEHQKYLAFKIIEPQVRGCLDRERELEKRLETMRKETAEKFAEMAKEKFAYDIERCKVVDEVCKEIIGGVRCDT